MQTALFLAYLALVFIGTAGFASVCRKAWYPRHFPVTFGLACTLVIGSISAFGAWSNANSLNVGEAGPVDIGP